jgi:ubiquinone/menaquinone biosynthesis C-methylase UbiE
MSILRSFFNNTSKPEGLLGKWMVCSMNWAHASVADWGMAHLSGSTPREIADIGCGGGRNVKKLLHHYPQAKVTAVDYSEISVEKTKQVNFREIQSNRCRVLQGDVSCLPFSDKQYDLVTAFETVYFWPGPVESFREVYRILKPGGKFLIVNEADGMNTRDEKWLSVIDGMKIYNKMQLSEYLVKTGFSNISIDHNIKKHSLCVIAVRPE